MEQLKELLNKLHEKGIKLPYFRDPTKGVPSVSLTLLIISFCFYFLTLINKLGGWFDDVDGAFQVLVLTAGLYFGRSFSANGKGKVTSENKEKDNE